MMKNIKNKLLDISVLTLFFTIYGTFILFMYANVHKISFYDIFSSQMFIAIGIASLAMTLLSIAYFVIFTYITKLMLDYLFGKELFTININYFLYLTFSFLLSLVFFRFSLDVYEWYIPLSIAWISFIPLSVIVSFKINENGFFCLFLKTLTLFSFGFGFFTIAGFIFITFNEVNIAPYYNILLSIIYFFSLVTPVIFYRKKNVKVMRFSGYTRYKKQIKKDNKISLNITIGLMILFTTPAWTNISNTVIKIIGIGYEERCYYSDDLNKYNVPDELIDTSNGISKIFVLSDVSNKIYVGKLSEPTFFYSFTYSNLNRIKCFKSSTIERND